MRIVIIVEAGPAVGRRWLLRPGDRMVFGRTERSDIVIADDPLLSSCHFRISIDGDDCQIEDMQSTNGTKLNDQRIATRPLADGDRIAAGQSTFTIRADSPEVCLQSTWVPETSQDSPAEVSDPAGSDAPPAPVEVPIEDPTSPNRGTPEPVASTPATAEPIPETVEEYDAFATSATPVNETPASAPPVAESSADVASPATDDRAAPSGDRVAPSGDRVAPSGDRVANSAAQPADPTGEEMASTLPPSQPPLAPAPAAPTPAAPIPAAQDGPVIPPSTTPGEVPSGFEIRFNRCPTGLWSGTQTAPLLGPADLAVILAGSCPLQLIVDFARSGLSTQAVSNPESMKSLTAEAAANDSPQILPADLVPLDQWVGNGWGSDGMILLMTHVDIDPILDYFRGLLDSAGPGMSAVSWPSNLEPLLSSGDAGLAQEIMEPCEAILVESPGAVGGWTLLGDDRITPLLDACRINHRFA